MFIQNNLFNNEQQTAQNAPTKWQRTEEKIARVYEHQAEQWKQAVLEFAEQEFLPGRELEFMTEDLRKAYDEYAKNSGKPATVQPKAWAGIMTSLRKRRLISKRGVGYRDNFVLAPSYISLI